MIGVREAKVLVWRCQEHQLQGMTFTGLMDLELGHFVFTSPRTHRPVVLLPDDYIEKSMK